MEVTLVPQDDDNGCVPACLAMILGCSYEDVTKDFDADFTKKGVTAELISEYLGDRGYSVVRKSVECYVHKDFGREMLLTPFAPIHIVHLKHSVNSDSYHVVVMDSQGKLLDPAESSEEDVRSAYQILEVFGIYK